MNLIVIITAGIGIFLAGMIFGIWLAEEELQRLRRSRGGK